MKFVQDEKGSKVVKICRKILSSIESFMGNRTIGTEEVKKSIAKVRRYLYLLEEHIIEVEKENRKRAEI